MNFFLKILILSILEILFVYSILIEMLKDTSVNCRNRSNINDKAWNTVELHGRLN